MLPTTKDPVVASAQESESHSSPNGSAAPKQDQRRTDAIGAEVPVIVHASRYSSAALGVGKNLPPVHEETRTVIVFPNGAVVRVSASMAAGELVVLTNQRTGADVICKVVNVKTQPGIQNYVNLEFTQRAPGFWDANSPSDKSAALQSAAPVPTSLPGTVAPAEIKPPLPQAAAPKPSVASLPAPPPTDLSFATSSPAVAEKPRNTAVLSGGLMGTVSNASENSYGSPAGTAEIKNWIGPRDAGAKAGSEISGSKKILLIAGAAVLLVSAGVAGGAWFFRNRGPSASVTQAATTSAEQSVPLPPVTTDQEAALPSQQDTAAESNSLQSAVVASNANGQPNVPAAQPAAASAPGDSLDEQPGKLPRITATPQPTRRPSMAVEKLSAPIAKTPDVGTSVEAPIVAGQINGLADSSTFGNGLNSEAPRPSAPVVPTHTGGQIQPAKPLTTVAPNYPLNATAQHIEGVVTIDAKLDSTGKVVFMKVLSGPPELQQAAMNALAKWKYQPAMLNGQPIGSDTVVNLSFTLPKRQVSH